MTSPSADLLLRAHQALERVNDPSEGNSDPESELEQLRELFPDKRFRFLSQRENLDDSLCWSLLIISDTGATTSLSWTPPSAVPWSLRGSRRTEESTLLRVNGIELSVEEAIWHLDILWEDAALVRKLVDVCLVRQELQESPVTLSTPQLQGAIDGFRRSRGLLTAEATEQWMRIHGLDHQSLEDLVAYEASVVLLRQRVADKSIASVDDRDGRDRGFERWLHQRRAESKIEWFWGETARTADISKRPQ